MKQIMEEYGIGIILLLFGGAILEIMRQIPEIFAGGMI